MAEDQPNLFSRRVMVRTHGRKTAKGPVMVIGHQRRQRHAEYGHQAAPIAGERGYRAPKARPEDAWDGAEVDEVARDVLRQAIRLKDDPDIAALYRGESFEIWDQEDLPDLLGLPQRGHDGKRLDIEERIAMAVGAINLAMEITPEGWGGSELEQFVPRGESYVRAPRTGGYVLPLWAARAVFEDRLNPVRKTRLVNVPPSVAEAFIAKHHSHLPRWNPKGMMYALGAFKGERLVAVATAGTPTGHYNRISPDQVIELTRVASDGTTRGAASKLTSRLIDLVNDSVRGDRDLPGLFVTYSLDDDEGAGYKALAEKGLRPVAATKGKKPSGARATSQLGGRNKIRWEAGPAAAPARWDLLES